MGGQVPICKENVDKDNKMDQGKIFANQVDYVFMIINVYYIEIVEKVLLKGYSIFIVFIGRGVRTPLR